MKKTILIIFWLLAVCSMTFAQTQKPPPENKSEIINIAGTSIKTPIKLIWIDSYRDGGTIGATIEDDSGKKLDFCIDKVGGGEFKNIYLGIKHPGKYQVGKTAAKLPIAGNDEKNFLKALQSWKESNEKNSYLLTELIEEIEKRNFPERVANKKPNDVPEKPPVDSRKARKLADEFVDDLVKDRRDKIKTKIDKSFYTGRFDGDEQKELDARIDYQFKNRGWKPLECRFERDKVGMIYDEGHKIPSHRFLYICKTTNPDTPERQKNWSRVIKVSVWQNEKQLFIRSFFLDSAPTATNPDKDNYVDVLSGNF